MDARGRSPAFPRSRVWWQTDVPPRDPRRCWKICVCGESSRQNSRSHCNSQRHVLLVNRVKSNVQKEGLLMKKSILSNFCGVSLIYRAKSCFYRCEVFDIVMVQRFLMIGLGDECDSAMYFRKLASTTLHRHGENAKSLRARQ